MLPTSELSKRQDETMRVLTFIFKKTLFVDLMFSI
jgi:hypothetical protein